MIPCSSRRCTHVDADGVRCITRLANPGPDCFIHQAALIKKPSYEEQAPTARELLGRLMTAHPTAASERRAA